MSSQQVCVNLNNVQNIYCGYNSQKHNNNKEHSFAHSSDMHFKGNAFKALKSVKKLADDKVVYHHANKLVSTIDGILGTDGFLASNVQKAKQAGLKIENDTIILSKPTLRSDVISTLKYPFTDLWFDLINSACKSLKKTPLSSVADKILGNNFIKQNIDRVQARKSYDLVCSMFEQLVGNNGSVNVDKIKNKITLDTTAKLTKTAKNYRSRDERTLNRFVTGAVGAAFSSVDMHNISMLEKDDKNAAKKAQKDRWEQEMTRIGLSSLLTFFSLGALNKFAKGSDLRSAIIVAASALTAEIVSRIRKHKPLVPLKPERAAQIAKEQNNKKQKASPNSVETAIKRINKNDKNNLYKDFTQNKINTVPVQNEQNPIEENISNKKKKNNILKWVGLAFAVSNIIFFGSRWLKGSYAQQKARVKVFEEFHDELLGFINSKNENAKLSSTVIDALKEAKEKKPELLENISKRISKNNREITVFNKTTDLKTLLNLPKDILTKLKNKILLEDTTIDLKKLEEEIEQLGKVQGGKDIEPILNVYKQQIRTLKYPDGEFKLKTKKTIPNAICAGATKIFKTLYIALSSPAYFIDKQLTSKYKNTEKVFKKVEGKLYLQNPKFRAQEYKKELAQLNELFAKNTGKKDKYEKIAEHIKIHTRNFELNSETGDLANLSRTMVTLISSYFYVNDFRNTVLIESEGKNTQRAKEVTNDSVSFKLANFFFNGTLMNLANSLLKEPLNNSLLAATIIPTCTEFINEFLIRKTISRPMRSMNSREEIIEHDQKNTNRKGPAGIWTRFYKKITGQKSLVEKYEAQQANKNK